MLKLIKTKPAKKSYQLYTYDSPAEWALVDDAGIVRASIKGRVGHAGVVLWQAKLVDGSIVDTHWSKRNKVIEAARAAIGS